MSRPLPTPEVSCLDPVDDQPVGDQPAVPLDVEAVWHRFAEELHGFVARRIADHDRVQDVVAEVLLRVHRRIDEVRDPASLAAWLFTIARNAVTDEYRRASRRPVPVGGVADAQVLGPEGSLGGVAPSADAWVDDQADVLRELSRCLRPLLAELPDVQREALQMVELDGLTQVEAARRAGVTTSGMKSRVQRGRRQLLALVQRCCTVELDGRGLPIDRRPGVDCRCSGH